MFLYNNNNNVNAGKDREIALWESLSQGDKKALDTLFRLYYSPLFNYGMTIIPSEADVRDAIQKLFLKLWEKHSSLSIPNSIKAYLLVSIRRILLDNSEKIQNRYERNRKYIDNDVALTFSEEDLMIRDEIEEEKKERLVKALNHLSARQKETLFLRYYHGLTNKEIAEVLGINQQSAKNNIYRTLKKLRSIIKPVPELA